MKIQYDSGATPRKGKYRGGVYQSYSAGQQLLSNKRNGRSRYPAQFDTSRIMVKVTKAWRLLSDAQRAAWDLWAAYCPQPTKRDSLSFLSGYQNFIKRNFYELLFFGINAPLVTNPALSIIDDSSVTPTLTRSGADLLLSYNWSRSGGDIWAGVFVSHIISQGKIYNLNFPRYVGVIDNGGGFTPVYGCLYNWYANFPTGTFLSSSNDWSVPEVANFTSLQTFLGGSSVAGGKMKETGFDFFDSPNTGASNSSGFYGRGSGQRTFNGTPFNGLRTNGYLRVASPTVNVKVLFHNSAVLGNANIGSYYRAGIVTRLVNLSTSLSNGQSGTYTGNDGKVYPTVCIGNQEWLAANLCETKFRDGSDIPYVAGNAAWGALSTPGMCYYNNDQSLAYSSGSTAADISPGWNRNFGVLPAVGDYVILRFVKVGKANGQFLGEEQFTLPITA